MSTTSPARRIRKVTEKLEPAIVLGDKESNPDTKTGSKKGKRKRGRVNPIPKLHRYHSKPKYYKEGVDMDSIVNAIHYILENHGKNVRQVINGYKDKETLSKMAKKCMATCLGGWEEVDGEIVSENTDLVLSKNSWAIAEDGSAMLKGGFKFDYDWLYNLSNASILNEEIDSIETSEIDKDSFSDTLSNASNLLRKLSDKEVKKYILNAAKSDEDIDLMNLKEVLEDTGVNWRFIGAEISGEKINLLIKVRYSKDGTQEGVIEKKLSVEVKPTADVTETSVNDEINNDDIDLAFPSSESESEMPMERSKDPEAGLDFEVNL